MTDPPAPPPFAPPSVPNALRGSLHGKGHHAGDSEANHSGRGFGTGVANESSAASDDSSTIGGGNIDSSAGGVARSGSSVTGGGLGNRFLAALGVSFGTQKSSWSSSSDDQTKTLRHVFAPGDPVRYSNFSDAAKLPRFETLMRTIYPGQVSVTADTWLSVQHALPEGVSPVDLGAHKLRCKTVMVEPCNGVRFDSNNGGGIMDSLDGGSGDEGQHGAAAHGFDESRVVARDSRRLRRRPLRRRRGLDQKRRVRREPVQRVAQDIARASVPAASFGSVFALRGTTTRRGPPTASPSSSANPGCRKT